MVAGFMLASILAMSACSDSEPASKPSPSASSSAAPVPHGTPIVELSLSGDAALTGKAADLSVRCDFPDLEGESIAVLGKAFDGETSVRLGVFAGKVTVRLFGTSTGGSYVQRDFEGTDVSGFDVTEGATIDSSLTETVEPTASASSGSLGAVTSVKGTIQCNDQDPGTSGLTLTGDTAEGTLNRATLDHARVECNQDPAGNEVVVLGLLTVGSTKAFVSVGLRADGLSVIETFELGAQRRYRAPPGSATATSTGGHASGDAVEQFLEVGSPLFESATPPHAIHVEGDVTCGSPTTG